MVEPQIFYCLVYTVLRNFTCLSATDISDENLYLKW